MQDQDDNRLDTTRTSSHDPDFPKKLLFMRTSWRDNSFEARPRPEAADYARRRDQLSAAYSSATLPALGRGPPHPSGHQTADGRLASCPFPSPAALVPSSWTILRHGSQ